MCEINRHNFKQKLPLIENSLKAAKFISIDLEFSALHPLPNQIPSLFDTNKERYSKFRKNLEQVIPLQVGIAAFHYDPDKNDYHADVFNFFVCPKPFANMDRSFYFQSSSVAFLALYNFDFNKLFYSGIPYLNNVEQANLRNVLKDGVLFGENGNFRFEYGKAVDRCVGLIKPWYIQSKIGDILEMGDIYKKYSNFYEVLYFLHKDIRGRFKNVWTYETDDKLVCKKVTDEDFKKLSKQTDLDEDFLDELTGFSKVFKLLTTLQKPIVGHNLFQDLLLMTASFERPLPRTYSQFKELIMQLFPTIFDTKSLYYEIRKFIPDDKLPYDTSLECLFTYFKNGLGRHLVHDTAAIECNIPQEKFDRYHEASWDAFCTGYIFIRMGHYSVSRNYPKSKVFVSSEIIGGLSQYRNRVNVIRGSSSYARLDGEDPSSTRPPWLIVESLKSEPVDVIQLTSMLSSYGFVDIKKVSNSGTRFLLAVDNFRTARDISRNFKTNSQFRIRQYNVFRHSPAIHALLLTTVTISGTLLVWLSHKMARS